MPEKIDWNLLEKEIKCYTVITKKLPEGLYACPRCEASGRIPLGNRDMMCGMCRGSRIIKRCKSCKENPIPYSDQWGLCDVCQQKRMKEIIELEKRPKIVCNFPQWTTNCPNTTLQEKNSKGELVCGLDLCPYSHPPVPLSPDTCDVKKIIPDYCGFCIHKKHCKVK